MWTTSPIAGRLAEVYTPAQVRAVVLFLPDIDGQTLRDHDTWATLFAQHGLACVVLDGGESWWLDRVVESFHPTQTAEDYLLEEVLPWVRANIGTQPVALAGIGMGGQGALRISFRHPETFKMVGTLAAALDFHEAYGSGSALDTTFTSKEQARLATTILQIQGWKWPTHLWFTCDPNNIWHRGNDRLASKLTALGVPFTADLETTTCGHSWACYNAVAPRLVRFLAEATAKEAKRLL